ncbi:MAG: HEAT repeat domain-containing protein [Elusimicrobiota bacterium]
MDLESFYTLDITEVCGYRCVFCITRTKTPKAGGRMTPLSAVKAQLPHIRKMGHKTVCFTGGEPTLHPDLPAMVRAARRAGLEAVINTHGMRFADKRYLARYAGLDFSCVLSMHSHKETVYNKITGTKGFRRTIQGIRNLLNADIPIVFSHVLSAQNYADFPGWVAYVRRSFRGRVSASIFFNQENDAGGSMVRFSRVRPHLHKGLRGAGFPITYLTGCTASHCLIEPNFFGRRGSFSAANRRRNLARLRALPLIHQKQLLNYFVAEKCYRCVRFMKPACKGIRKKYLLRFGGGEFGSLLNAEERSYIDALRRRMRSGELSPPMRSSSHILLGATGADSAGVVPALCRVLLGDADHHVRREAALALGGLGSAARGAVPALRRALRDTDALIRQSAVHALSRLEPPPREAIGALLRALRDADTEVRRYGALALAKYERLPRKAVRPLTALLRSADAQTRRYGVLALTRTPSGGGPALLRVLRDPDAQTREHAAVALARAPRAESAAALLRALSDGEERVGVEAAYALSRLPRLPVKAAAPLIRALSARSPRLRANAALALAKVRPLPRRAAAALTQALADSEAEVRREAVSALVALKPVPRASVSALARALDDPDAHVRREAARALEKKPRGPGPGLSA